MGEKPKNPGKDKPHYLGHRERLRARLLEALEAHPDSLDTLPDYELLEFLLFSAKPRGDTKPLAKELLKRFGGLSGVLGASRETLVKVPGMGEASAAQLLAVRQAGLRLLRA